MSPKNNNQEQSFDLFTSTSSHGRLGDTWPHSAHSEVHGSDDAEIFTTEIPGPLERDELISEDYLGFLDSGNPEGQPTLGALWDELNEAPDPPDAHPRRSSSPYTQTERALRSRLLPQSEQSCTQSQHSQRTVAIVCGNSQPVDHDDSPPVASAEGERGSGNKPIKAQLTSNSSNRRTKIHPTRSAVHNDAPKPPACGVEGTPNAPPTVLSEQKAVVHNSPRHQNPAKHKILDDSSNTISRTVETSPFNAVKQALNRQSQPSKRKQVAKRPFVAGASESVSEQVCKHPTYGIEVQKITTKPTSNGKIQKKIRGLQEDDPTSKALTETADPYEVPVSSNDDAPSSNHVKRRKRAAGKAKLGKTKQTKSKGRMRLLPESPLSMDDLTDLSADKSWETALTAAKAPTATKSTPESSRDKQPKRTLGAMQNQDPLEQAAETISKVKRIKKHGMLKNEQEFPNRDSAATRTSLQKLNQGRSHGQTPSTQSNMFKEDTSQRTEKPITPVPPRPMEPVLISSDSSTQLSDLRDQGRSNDEYLPPMSSPQLLADKVFTGYQKQAKASKQVDVPTVPCSVEAGHPQLIAFHGNGSCDQLRSSADKREAGKNINERRFKRSEVAKTPFGVSILSQDTTPQAPIVDKYSSFSRSAEGVTSTHLPLDIDVAASQDIDGSRVLNRPQHTSSNSMMTKTQGRRVNGALDLPEVRENVLSQDCVKAAPAQDALPRYTSTFDRAPNKVQNNLHPVANGRASEYEKDLVTSFSQKASKKFADDFKSALKMDPVSTARTSQGEQHSANGKPRKSQRPTGTRAAHDTQSANVLTDTPMIEATHNRKLMIRPQNINHTVHKIAEMFQDKLCSREPQVERVADTYARQASQLVGKMEKIHAQERQDLVETYEVRRREYLTLCDQARTKVRGILGDLPNGLSTDLPSRARLSDRSEFDEKIFAVEHLKAKFAAMMT